MVKIQNICRGSYKKSLKLPPRYSIFSGDHGLLVFVFFFKKKNFFQSFQNLKKKILKKKIEKKNLKKKTKKTSNVEIFTMVKIKNICRGSYKKSLLDIFSNSCDKPN